MKKRSPYRLLITFTLTAIMLLAMTTIILASNLQQIEPGTIIIKKDTVPDGGTGFTFTDTIVAPFSFSLDDDGYETFFNVLPGQYTVTEDDPAPTWILSSLVCEDLSGGTTVDVLARSAYIDLAAGETVTCTFANGTGNAVEMVTFEQDLPSMLLVGVFALLIVVTSSALILVRSLAKKHS
jgi:hypothetical protein